jgi:hypothetical protein
MLFVALIAACAASRDRDPHTSVEPRAVPTEDGIALRSQSFDRRAPSRQRFGVVVHREIGVSDASFVLAVARGCREQPRPTPPRDVLLEPDADTSRCRLHLLGGPVALSLRRADGRWWNDAIISSSDREGRLHIRFADLDDQLARLGARLDQFTSLRVGHGGWAGSYDLVRLRAVQADLHAQWVEQGRGTPALFALRHGAHPRAAHALELAALARLARQEQDFAAVTRGELAASAFLDRYVWSPLRHRAVELLLERRKPTGHDPQP